MNEVAHDKLENFIQNFKEALELPPAKSESILEEVSADLEAHVERFRADGLSEDEAADRALEEMGNPFELAHRVRREVPPFGGRAVTVIRYVAAIGLILWTLFLIWNFRAWTYGFSQGVIAVAVLFHVPGILLLWPRIVWRKNWLFGFIPAGLAVLVALIVAVAGVQSSTTVEIAMPIDGEIPINQAVAALPAASDPSKTPLVFLSVALAAATVVLLMAMQQRVQRRVAMLALLLGVGTVEAAFQLEEMAFRNDRDQLLEFVEATFRESGTYPTRTAMKNESRQLKNESFMLNVGDEDFSLFWNRPLSSGFAIVYSSANNEIRIQD